MKVLLVDDDPDQLLLRGMLLRQSGFETAEATDILSAIEMALAYKPPLAVVDLRLPDEETGLSLIRQLKTLDPAIKLFVLTGADPTRFARHPESQLVEDVFVKGSSAQLTQRLRAAAALAHRHASPAPRPA
jgi:two-component system response regulator RegA